MPSPFLEIIQLANGEIVLQRADEEGEPLVNIRFSKESRDYIGDAELDIAKAMIQAGIEAAAYIGEIQASGLEDETSNDTFVEDWDQNRERVLH